MSEKLEDIVKDMRDRQRDIYANHLETFADRLEAAAQRLLQLPEVPGLDPWVVRQAAAGGHGIIVRLIDEGPIFNQDYRKDSMGWNVEMNDGTIKCFSGNGLGGFIVLDSWRKPGSQNVPSFNSPEKSRIAEAFSQPLKHADGYTTGAAVGFMSPDTKPEDAKLIGLAVDPKDGFLSPLWEGKMLPRNGANVPALSQGWTWKFEWDEDAVRWLVSPDRDMWTLIHSKRHDPKRAFTINIGGTTQQYAGEIDPEDPCTVVFNLTPEQAAALESPVNQPGDHVHLTEAGSLASAQAVVDAIHPTSWASYECGPGRVQLDGEFTLEELEAIIKVRRETPDEDLPE
jgi:hypothetical protein